MLIDTVDDYRPIIWRTPRRIFSCTGAGHDIVLKVAVVGREEWRNGSIEEALEYIVVVDNGGPDRAWCRVKDILEHEACELWGSHCAWVNAKGDEVVETFVTAQLNRRAGVKRVDVDEELRELKSDGSAVPISWESLLYPGVSIGP